MRTISHQRAAAMIKSVGGDYASVKASGLAVGTADGLLSYVDGAWRIAPPVSGGSPDDGQDGPITVSRRSGPYDADAVAAWDAVGGDAIMDSGVIDDGGDVRNEWPSEDGDSSGELFSALEEDIAPDGHTYHVLLTSYWDNYISPWVDTDLTLYRADRPEEVEQFKAEVARWEAKPETHPDYEDDQGDDSDDDDSDPTDDDNQDDEDDVVPNIDGHSIDPEEVRSLADRFRSDARIGPIARLQLARYAEVKADAMVARLAGDIPTALRLEAECDRIYRALPERYRW